MKIWQKSSKHYLSFLWSAFLFLFSSGLLAQDDIIFLWSTGNPDTNSLHQEEVVFERSKNPAIPNRIVKNISSPRLQIYNPEKPNGKAILICPGGAYAYQAFDKEGDDIARWMNRKGIKAFVLRYRLPAEGIGQQTIAPVQDVQRAMRLIRSNAESWNIFPDKIGVIGFSAGGHLAAMLTVHSDTLLYSKTDSVDLISCLPDYMILMYPVISMDDSITHTGSKENLLGKNPTAKDIEFFSAELHVTTSCPPSLIISANDDVAVNPENSRMMYEALISAGVDAELNLIPGSEHGFGLRSKDKRIAGWTELCEKWLLKQQILP